MNMYRRIFKADSKHEDSRFRGTDRLCRYDKLYRTDERHETDKLCETGGLHGMNRLCETDERREMDRLCEMNRRNGVGALGAVVLFGVAAFSFFAGAEDLSRFYLSGQHFFSKPSHPDQRSDYSAVYINWNESSRFQSFFFKLNGVSEIFLNNYQFYFSVPSAFASYTYYFPAEQPFQIQSLEFSLGRRVYSYSYADDYWDLGLWNSLSKWNPLTPFQNGLIGGFFHLKGGKWSSRLFVGGLYLPNQGIKIRLKQGSEKRVFHFNSSARWFTGLPRQVEAFDSLFDINYLVQDPFLLDVLFQPGSIFSFKVWSGGKPNYWIRASMGYKPANNPFSIRNDRKMVKAVAEKDENPLIFQQFTFFPLKHQIFSVEWGMDYDDLSILFSAGEDSILPVKNLPEGWSAVKANEDFAYLSGFLTYQRRFSDQLKGSARAGFLKSWFQTNSDSQHSQALRPSSRRSDFKVTEGVGMDVSSQWEPHGKFRLDMSLQYWFSLPDRGGLLSLSGDCWFSKKVFTGMSLFILGAEKEMDTFLNRFRANDYFFWRVGYAF